MNTAAPTRSSRSLPLLALTGLLGVCIWIDTAAAGDRVCNTQVAWRAPASCPDRGEFLALLGAELSSAPVDLVHLDIRIVEQRGLFVLTWRISSGTADSSGLYRNRTDPRTLADSSCAAVVEAAVTAIATAIEPVIDESRGDPLDSPRPCPQREDLDVPDVLLPAPVSFSGLDEFPLRGPTILGLPFDLAVQVMLGGDSGTLPGVATSIHASVASQYGRWRLEVGGAQLLEQRRTVSRGDSEMGGDLSLRTATLRLCAEVHRGLIITSICAGGQLGLYRSAGYNLLAATETTETYAAAGWATSFSRALQEFLYFRADINIWSPTRRPRFTVCDVAVAGDGGFQCSVPTRTLWQPRRVVTRIFAGLEVRFR